MDPHNFELHRGDTCEFDFDVLIDDVAPDLTAGWGLTIAADPPGVVKYLAASPHVTIALTAGGHVNVKIPDTTTEDWIGAGPNAPDPYLVPYQIRLRDPDGDEETYLFGDITMLKSPIEDADA